MILSRYRWLFLPSVALVAALGAADARADETVVTWDWANAQLHGSGCHGGGGGDVSYIVAGNELTMIFSGITVDLDGAGGNAANSECHLTVPVLLPNPTAAGGWHIRSLDEALFYGYVRTAGATGSVDFASHLFGLSTANLSAAVPGNGQDPVQEPYLELDSTTEIVPHGSPCNQGHRHGQYLAQLKLAARRQSKADAISIAVDGQDVRLTLRPTVEADHCTH